jgi:catechol 2,3-dioxygenase-like lactoylglutathione lyase family enzyme
MGVADRTVAHMLDGTVKNRSPALHRTGNALRWGLHELPVVGLVVCLLTLYDAASHAQLAVPGPSGVVMGHLHLATTDVEASRRFWAALGGVAVQNGQLQLIQLPGTFVMLRQSQQTTGGTEGSTVERVMLRVRTSELPQLVQKLGEMTGSKASALLKSPEGVTIELRGAAASQETAVRMERLDFRTVAPAETRDWYVKTFGAESGLLAGATPQVYIARLPGLVMYFRKGDAAPAGTRGRGLDHIGFEVKNLEEFCKKLEAAGQKFDRPYGRLPNSTTAIAFLTDAWGTYIELTENLAPPK